MPVPAGTPSLTLGRALFDKRRFRQDTDPEIIACLERMAMAASGRGWDGPAKGDDPVYMAVYAQPDGLGAHNLYGGNPADPVNPTPLVVSASGSATVNWEEEGVLVLSSGTANFVGTGVTVTDVAGTATITITGGGGGGTVTEAFKTISVAGQSDIVADLAADTLTVVASTGMVITTTAGTDTLTFAIDTATVAQHSFKTIAVSGQSDVVADSPTDTLTLVAGAGMLITTNAGGDEVTFTVSATVAAGLYIDVSGSTVDVDLTEVPGYDDDLLLGSLTPSLGSAIGATDVQFRSVPHWLKLLSGWATADYMSIGSDMGGDAEWQADGVC